MILNINGKDYTFKFGIAFMREMDKRYEMNTNGIKYGASMEVRIPFLLTKDILILSEILLAGNQTENPRLHQNDLDRFLDEVEDIEAVFDEVIEELKKSNATRLKIAQIMKSLQEPEKNLMVIDGGKLLN